MERYMGKEQVYGGREGISIAVIRFSLLEAFSKLFFLPRLVVFLNRH